MLKKKMETPRFLNLLALLLLLLLCFAVSDSFAAARAAFMRRPGFAFTRTKGKCTPQFWSSRRAAWPRMVPQTSTVSKVFGSRAYERYRSDMTLMEAAAWNEDEQPFGRLLKEATAALLNSYARTDFPFSAWEVKTLLIEALVSEEAAGAQYQLFSVANESCN